MNAEHEKARRHAENTLAEVNRHMETRVADDPKKRHMLTDMMEKATRTLRNLDDMENNRSYSDTRIGYNANSTQNRSANNESDAYGTMRSAMNAIGKILPQISNDTMDDVMDALDDAEARRGVPGTGRRSGRGRKRVRVGGYTRRAEMDDMDDDMDDDARSNADNDQRMRSAMARAAADAAAMTASRMSNDMARSDYGNANSDARGDADNYSRSDNATSDRSQRPGPRG